MQVGKNLPEACRTRLKRKSASALYSLTRDLTRDLGDNRPMTQRTRTGEAYPDKGLLLALSDDRPSDVVVRGQENVGQYMAFSSSCFRRTGLQNP